MSETWSFRNKKWESSIIKSFQWRPSKCDTVLKCDDGQVYLSRISLVVASAFWKELLLNHDIQSETTLVILLPGFNKEKVLEILQFLKKGELKTECCSNIVQRIINSTKVLLPDIDIFSFYIQKISKSEREEISDEEPENVKDDHITNTDELVVIKQTVEQDQASKITKIETKKSKFKILNFNQIKESKEETSEHDESSNDDTDKKNDDTFSNSFDGVEVGKTKEHRHACTICLKYFVRKSTLDRHIEIVHLKTQTSICTICGQTFASKDGLKVHMKKHDESHPSTFKCPECGKMYTNSQDLDKHCQTTGHDFLIKDTKKPNQDSVKCEICHKWVIRLKYHMEKHHSNGRKTFSCDHCDFITNRRDTLYRHERRTHDQHYRDFKAIQETLKTKENLKCFDCGKKFETAADIKEHIALNGCKENKCNHCGKTFNIRYNLLQHIREVHEVTKTFECPFCSKTFNQKRGRDRHVKICKKNNMNNN